MRIKFLHICSAAMAAMALLLGVSIHAQTLTVLHNFGVGSDGALSGAGLIVSSNVFYGTAFDGGAANSGMLFSVRIDGTAYTDLHDFASTDKNNRNSGGADPGSPLILNSNILYGTAENGGTGSGCIFAISTNGFWYSVLHNFTATPANASTNPDGATPLCSLIASPDGYLYGTAAYGGTYGYGTIYKMQTNGAGFTNLHSFNYPVDGNFPKCGLVLSSNIIYGIASSGGPYPALDGTVFSIHTDGTAFTILHAFSNVDGYSPNGTLLLVSNTLYCTCQGGGSNGGGTLFAVNTDGSGFTNLHEFSGLTNDGSGPISGVTLSGNALYGPAGGGAFSSGVLYRINLDGTGYTNLYNFTGGSDGSGPVGLLLVMSNNIYGMTRQGGLKGWGTAYALALPQPQLTSVLTSDKNNVVFTWPATPAFALQTSTNLGPNAVWSTNQSAPTIVNGQNTTTIPTTPSQQYFRLIAQ